jgi:hypothetical protein
MRYRNACGYAELFAEPFVARVLAAAYYDLAYSMHMKGLP